MRTRLDIHDLPPGSPSATNMSHGQSLPQFTRSPKALPILKSSDIIYMCGSPSFGLHEISIRKDIVLFVELYVQG